MNTKTPHEHHVEPERHLPKIGEKPAVPRLKRWLRIGFVVSGLFFVAASCGLRYLQTHVPGPRPVYVQPASPPSLSSLAVEKGFPKECLISTLYANPINTGNTDPSKEDILCMYTGHPAGQPEPGEPCQMILERSVQNDPYYFSTAVVGTDGNPIYLGKSPKFTEAVATPGLPPACVPENATYP